MTTTIPGRQAVGSPGFEEFVAARSSALLRTAGEGVSLSSVGGGGSDLLALLEPDSPPARIRARGDVGPRAQLGFALYERVD